MVFTKDKYNKLIYKYIKIFIYKYNKIYIYIYNKIAIVFTKDKYNKININIIRYIYKYNKIYIYINTIRLQWFLQKLNIIR